MDPFSAIFEQGHVPAQVQAARRACIQDTLERQVAAAVAVAVAVAVVDRPVMPSVAPAS